MLLLALPETQSAWRIFFQRFSLTLFCTIKGIYFIPADSRESQLASMNSHICEIVLRELVGVVED